MRFLHIMARKDRQKSFMTSLKEIADIPYGELVINNIDLDGVMTDDLEMCDKVRELTEVPLTFLGGAGSYDDLKALVDRFGVIGAAAGSIFVFKGKYKAVLIQYPLPEEKERIQPLR